MKLEKQTMQKDVYLDELTRLKELMAGVPNTPFTIYSKIVTLAAMNLRYEKVAFALELSEHPYLLAKKIISDAITQFNIFQDMAFVESDDKTIEKFKTNDIIKKHEELWQEIWSRHNEQEFQEFIDLKAYRLDINNLNQYVENKDCVDVGCGNGVFAFAMLQRGAKSAVGIDFGEKSIGYANMVAEKRNISDKVNFKVADVLDTKLPTDNFDFAVSNGVFHHLKQDNIEKALKEVARVLKVSGWFWYYMDGKGAISMDLWDASVGILKDVDILIIEEILSVMNIKRNKMVHLMDGLSATYLHSTWAEVTEMLSRCGFGNFVRLTGGTDKDFDLDKIEADPYGKEKFGEGDLRLLCQLLRK